MNNKCARAFVGYLITHYREKTKANSPTNRGS